MGIGAERPVADEQVAFVHRRVELGGVGQVVGVPPAGDQVQQQARGRVEQPERMHHREAHPRKTSSRLSEGPLELRGVGHGDPAAINQRHLPPEVVQHAVARWPSGMGVATPDRLAVDRVHHPAQHIQRQPTPGLAKRLPGANENS